MTVAIFANAPPFVDLQTAKLVSLLELSLQVRITEKPVKEEPVKAATRLVGAANSGPTVTGADGESPAALKATTR